MVSNENGNEYVNAYRNDTTTEKLTDNEQLVLNAIRMDATVTIVKMVDLLGLSKATIARATKSLREKKVIDREGANKNGKWIILK